MHIFMNPPQKRVFSGYEETCFSSYSKLLRQKFASRTFQPRFSASRGCPKRATGRDSRNVGQSSFTTLQRPSCLCSSPFSRALPLFSLTTATPHTPRHSYARLCTDGFTQAPRSPIAQGPATLKSVIIFLGTAEKGSYDYSQRVQSGTVRSSNENGHVPHLHINHDLSWRGSSA